MRARVQLIADTQSLWATVAVIFGVTQFSLCLTEAISLYPGGYSLQHHFLSDLGRTSKASAPYFNRSLIVLSLCLILFFWNMTRENAISGVSGVISSMGLMGIGLTPLDKAFIDHHVALFFWLAPMLVMMVSTVIEGFRHHQTLLICGSIQVLVFGMLYVGAAGTSKAPFFQKLVVCLSVLWLMIVCGHSSLAVHREVTQRIRIGHDHQTQSYISQLERKGLTSRDGQRTGRALFSDRQQTHESHKDF